MSGLPDWNKLKNEIGPWNDFNIVRADRRSKRGGGVCLFIKKQYKFRKINIPNVCDMPEMLWDEI